MGLRIAAALIIALLPATAMARGVQDFQLTNRTGYVISEVYVSPVNTNDWEEDVLGRDVLSDGEAVDITFSPRENICDYDIKVIYDDKDEAEWEDFDLCTVSKISLFYNLRNGETSAEYE